MTKSLSLPTDVKEYVQSGCCIVGEEEWSSPANTNLFLPTEEYVQSGCCTVEEEDRTSPANTLT